MKVKREFKGVWINRNVWLNTELTIHEKFLLVEIDSLDNESSCFASNDYFAEFMGVDPRSIQRNIKSLIDKGYLERKLVYKPNSKEVEKRLLTVTQNINGKVVTKVSPGVVSEVSPGGDKSVADSNTTYNYTTTTKQISENFELIENIARKLKRTGPEVIAMVPVFVNYCISIEKKHNNNTDLFSHFGYWIEKQTFSSDDAKIEWFIKMFNKVSKQTFIATDEVKKAFEKQLANGFTGEQMKTACKNMYSSDPKNKFHLQSGFVHATPTHLLKDDNVNKYLNQRF
ncbi:helix-turn-helix domain-containing protein [Lutibacter holmesii]|uniref:Helix-turn-helix domain-containing protein n=1 Tax=Lutibacter holmesii TaxID=1137985 RepID=A0ABW3WLA1_9FLAO